MSDYAHLLPPENLLTREPKLFHPKGKWYRVVPKEFSRSPLYFGNHGTGRFDSKEGSLGVCYLGQTPAAAFAETLNRLLEDGCWLRLSAIENLIMFEFELSGEVNLINLAGTGLSRLGATLECFSGSDFEGYACSQEWGRQLMDHPIDAAGIHYLGRRAGESCLALFGSPGETGLAKRKAKSLRIRQTAKLSLIKSQAFADWLQECQYELKTNPSEQDLK